MGSIARDSKIFPRSNGTIKAYIRANNLDVIRIPRKVILAELIKKLGGHEAQHDCWFEDGRYWSVARTTIATTEADTSSKLEQAMGCLDATKEDAEEAAAIALIEVLKRTYRFEVDDVNFMKRAKAEYQNDLLEKQMLLLSSTEKKQSERAKKLSKCWDQLLDDMDFVQEACHDICGTTLATLPVQYTSGPLTDMIYSVNCLDEWTEQKIYENIAKKNETSEIDSMVRK